jgi:hypothetical protein
MIAFSVPLKLIVAISKLYKKGVIKIFSTKEVEVLNTLGLI